MHTTWLPVSESIVNLPTLPLHPPPTPLFVVSVIFQALFKTSLKISQSIHSYISKYNDSYIPTLFLPQILRGYYQA